MTERIKWVDCAKGIAMLLVIIGHTYSLSSNYREVIYSFHMPLFFILSGYTLPFSSNLSIFLERLKKYFVRLYVPVLMVFSITLLFKLITKVEVVNNDFIINALNTLLYSSGINININNTEINDLGFCWFLVSLFWAKIIVDYLNLKFSKKILSIILVFLTILGVFIGKKGLYLFFTLDVTFASLIFLLFGNFYRNIEIKKLLLLSPIICLTVWCGSLFLNMIYGDNFFELTRRQYSLFPICYLGAISASIVAIELSKKVVNLKYIGSALIKLGEISLYLFIVHCLDFIYKPLWDITNNETINGLIRFIIDLIITYILLKILESIRNKKLAK